MVSTVDPVADTLPKVYDPLPRFVEANPARPKKCFKGFKNASKVFKNTL